jgi:hypothetical protein
MDNESSSTTPAFRSTSVISTQASTPYAAVGKLSESKRVNSVVSSQASTPIANATKRIEYPRPQKKTIVKLPAAAFNVEKKKRGRPPKLVALIDNIEDGIVIHAKHSVRTIAGSKLAGIFSFYN